MADDHSTAAQEDRRLVALARYRVWDTPRESGFDDLAALAAEICETPIAVVNLIGNDRQWFKAEVGLGVDSTPLDTSFCGMAILEEDFLLVPDATQDERFSCNPLVTTEPGLRFYAGALLKSPDGFAIGTLCVLDYEPRTLNEQQQHALRRLARQVMAQLELRLAVIEREEINTELRASGSRFRAAVDAVQGILWTNNPSGEMEGEQPGWALLTGQSFDEYQGYGWATTVHPDDAQPTIDAWNAAVAEKRTFIFEHRVRRYDGAWRRFSVRAIPTFDAVGRINEWVGVHTDVTDLREGEERLRFLSILDEALRNSYDAPAAMLAAAGLLAHRLEASRTAYADVDADSNRFFIREDFTAPGIASSAGTYSLDLFGPRATADMRAGRTLVVRDVPGELAPGEGRETFLTIGIGAIVCCPLVKNGRLVAMMAVHQDVPRDWRDDEIALVETVVERCWAHVERVGAEARLRESEARFRNMADHAPTMMWVTDANAHCTYLNREWHKFTGQGEGQGEGFGWLEAVHPDDRGWSGERFVAANAKHEAFRLEYRLRRHDGKYRWAIDAASPRFGPRREFLGYIGSVIDIDERREMEDALRNTSLHQRLLIDELNHRVKNTLSTVQSIAMQTFRDENGTGAPPEQRQLFDSRLIALAKAHDVLTRENWESAGLRDVTFEAIAAHCGGDHDAFTVQGPDARLTPKMALSLSMALHELCTNAAKYGALSVSDGHVSISWIIERDGNAEQLLLRWEEKGGPSVTPPTRKGFGSRLIERQLARELRGSVELIYAPSGVTCIVKAPLSDAQVAVGPPSVAE